MEDYPKILKVEYLSNHCSYLPQILTSCSGDHTKIKRYLNWRRPPMEDDLKIFKVEYLSNHWMIPSNFKLTLRGLNQNTKMLETKTTSNWRQPHYIRSWISQQTLIGSCSNFKLKLKGLYQNPKIIEMKTTLNWRQPEIFL